MSKLYPLKFETIYKDKVWGGNRIKTLLGKDYSPKPNCGETWELSGLPGNISIVNNGYLAGNNIAELAEIYMDDLLGESIFENNGTEIPLLFKYVDTNDYLSIQVHPDDKIAAKRHNSSGKTEMWYVVHAEPNAEIIVGFKKDVTKNEYIHHLENKTLKEILNIEKAQKGDVFFIPAGRIHAIGAGITLAEIQQSSDITYRIYDWDRPDKDGNMRELHTKLAVDVIDFKALSQYKTKYKESINKSNKLIECSYFTTNLISFDKKIMCNYESIDSFIVIMCIEGSYHIEWQGGKDIVKCGETMMIPANMKNFILTPVKPSKVLETYINKS